MNKPVDTNLIREAVNADWHAETLISRNGVNLKYRVMRDTCAPFHTHADWPESFFVLSGVVTIDSEDGSVDLHPGQFYSVAAGVSHRASVVGEATLLVLDEHAG